MDWKWIVGTAVTLGVIMAGGVWSLVQVAVALTRQATEIKTKLEMILPTAQELPRVKQDIAVMQDNIVDLDDEVDKLRAGQSSLATGHHELANRISLIGPRR